MAVDDISVRTRRELEEAGLSVESASYLVDRPPGGWGSLVTRDYLRAEIGDTRAELRAEIAGAKVELRAEVAAVGEKVAAVSAKVDALAAELRKEMQEQTRWLTGALLVTITVITVILRVT